MILLLEATNYDTDITVEDITQKLVNEEDTTRGILNSCIDDALLWEESITQEEREDFWYLSQMKGSSSFGMPSPSSCTSKCTVSSSSFNHART